MNGKTHLYLLWTNDSPFTAEMMVFMYAINSLRKGWWERVTLIVWGGPAKLVAEDRTIQALVTAAQQAGVHVSACRACAEQLGVTAALETLNIEVIYWGKPLTDLLKAEAALLTI